MRQLRDPEQVALLPMVEGEVRRALDALPTEFKLAVILCDVEEFSYEEIARDHGVPDRHRDEPSAPRRKLLQRSLYNHALALGIVKGEERVGGAASAEAKGAAPADLAAYRARKRAADDSLRGRRARPVPTPRLLEAYLDGELDAAGLIEVEAHLNGAGSAPEHAGCERVPRAAGLLAARDAPEPEAGRAGRRRWRRTVRRLPRAMRCVPGRSPR